MWWRVRRLSLKEKGTEERLSWLSLNSSQKRLRITLDFIGGKRGEGSYSTLQREEGLKLLAS